MEVYRIDLSEWVASRRWRQLLQFIDGLPSASRLREAVFNDPAEAPQILADEVAAQDAALAAELAGVFGGSVRDLQERLGLDGDVDVDAPVHRSVWRPRISEWDVAAIQRAAIHGVLVSISSRTPQPKGWRAPGASDFFPTPRTLVDDLREALERDDYATSMAVFAPDARP